MGQKRGHCPSVLGNSHNENMIDNIIPNTKDIS